jgi:aryl-alcohol dehydrogenase-like predicted oxidoreductase
MDRCLSPEMLAKVDQMVEIAGDLGTTPARLALAWCLRDPAVASVIVGATRPQQVADNIGAIELDLSGDVIETLDRIFPGPEALAAY